MRAEQANLSAVILAAGESKRMGRAKALLRLNTRTFLEAICSRLRESGVGEVIVVLGAGADTIKKGVVLESERLVINDRYEDGQLSSLQCGLRAVSPLAGAVLVTLVDHPLITPSTYVRLKAAWDDEPDKIIVATFKGRGGHPVIFPRSVFSELMDAPAGVGARFVVRKDRSRVCRLECGDPGIVADIDRPEDYKKIVQKV